MLFPRVYSSKGVVLITHAHLASMLRRGKAMLLLSLWQYGILQADLYVSNINKYGTHITPYAKC
jgi:hypothetical protein